MYKPGFVKEVEGVCKDDMEFTLEMTRGLQISRPAQAKKPQDKTDDTDSSELVVLNNNRGGVHRNPRRGEHKRSLRQNGTPLVEPARQPRGGTGDSGMVVPEYPELSALVL